MRRGCRRPPSVAACRTCAWDAAAGALHLCLHVQDVRVGSGRRRPLSLATCRTCAWAAAAGAVHLWPCAGRAHGQRPQEPFIFYHVQDVRIGSDRRRPPFRLRARRARGQRPQAPLIFGYVQDLRVGSGRRRPQSLATCKTCAWDAAAGALNLRLSAGRAHGQRPQALSIFGYVQDVRVRRGCRRP